MPDRAVRRLIALEARRARPVILQTTLMAVAAVVVLVPVGWMTPPRLGWIFIAWSLAAPWSLPMSVLRDRLDGGLEFLQALPLPAARIAAARLLAAALFAVPSGLAAATTFWLLRGASMSVPAALLGGLELFALGTAGVALAAALGVGIALRLEARAFGNLVLSGFVALIAFHHLTNRYAPGFVPSVISLTRRPWTPTLVALGSPVLAALLGWLAFHLARTGIERFTPGRDRVTW